MLLFSTSKLDHRGTYCYFLSLQKKNKRSSNNFNDRLSSMQMLGHQSETAQKSLDLRAAQLFQNSGKRIEWVDVGALAKRVSWVQ